MAALLYIDTKATVRSAGGFSPACMAGNPAALTGADSAVRHRGMTAAGETSALVARCVL